MKEEDAALLRALRHVQISELSAPLRVRMVDDSKYTKVFQNLAFTIVGAVLGALGALWCANQAFYKQIEHEKAIRQQVAVEAKQERADARAAEIRDQYARIASERRLASAFIKELKLGDQDDVLTVSRLFEEAIASIRSGRTTEQDVARYFEKRQLLAWSWQLGQASKSDSVSGKYFNPDDRSRFADISKKLASLAQLSTLPG